VKFQKRTTTLYFTLAWGGGEIPECCEMNLGTFRELPAVMDRVNFNFCLMSGLRASGGFKKRFCLWNARGSYNVALRYRAVK
jgi:hypothetical protein